LVTLVTLTASVSDVDDAVTNVSFYANDHLLGRFTNAPYSLVWTNPALGSYTVAAFAVDSYGASTRVLTHVLIDTNHPPTVRISSPQELTTFHTRTNFTVTIQASDADANVQRVELLVNGISFKGFTNSTPSASFSVLWTNIIPGNYALTATALDDLGLSSTSPPVHLIYATAALMPGVRFFTSENSPRLTAAGIGGPMLTWARKNATSVTGTMSSTADTGFTGVLQLEGGGQIDVGAWSGSDKRGSYATAELSAFIGMMGASDPNLVGTVMSRYGARFALVFSF
jgi:hypothetical protein